MRGNWRRLWPVILLVLLGVLSTALGAIYLCTACVAEAKYNKLQPGMSFEEIESILGQPPDGAGAGESWEVAFWSDDEDNVISVSFHNGRAESLALKKNPHPVISRVRNVMFRLQR